MIEFAMESDVVINIFDYATKELSQDAFICWLVNNYDDESLGKYAYDFINFLSGLGLKNGDIKKLSTLQQYNDMDVIIDIWTESSFNESSDYVIIMENKTESSAHSHQLKKYGDKIDTWKNKNKFKIFYKSNYLNDRDNNEIEYANKETNNKWLVYDLNKIFEFFIKYEKKEVESEILRSYIDFILQKYNDLNYKKKPSENDYNEFRWLSFFRELKEKKYSKYVSWVGSTSYSYSVLCFRTEPFTQDGDPYLEIRSRDCYDNKFIARILTFGLNEERYANTNIKKVIKEVVNRKNSLFHIEKSEINNKQLARTNKDDNIISDEQFIALLDKCILEYEEIMNSVCEIINKK